MTKQNIDLTTDDIIQCLTNTPKSKAIRNLLYSYDEDIRKLSLTAIYKCTETSLYG